MRKPWNLFSSWSVIGFSIQRALCIVWSKSTYCFSYRHNVGCYILHEITISMQHCCFINTSETTDDIRSHTCIHLRLPGHVQNHMDLAKHWRDQQPKRCRRTTIALPTLFTWTHVEMRALYVNNSSKVQTDHIPMALPRVYSSGTEPIATISDY